MSDSAESILLAEAVKLLRSADKASHTLKAWREFLEGRAAFLSTYDKLRSSPSHSDDVPARLE